jgi:Asp-tRNA(Asn)/Glu-tRNA(Gln) amidotransferase A subunit family amidase
MLNQLTLTEMAAGVRSGRISSAELVEAHLDQIEAQQQRINAFVSVFAEEAMEAARAADEARLHRLTLGPLHGVPLTIKDSFDVAGQPTYCGSKLRLDHRAEEDSTAARRLREAGAILLGKTNTPEFLYNYETDNYIVGRTNNPWNPMCTSGGSSGGEAAAIAAFCSAGGMGSDGGGSIRVPAHFCGIAGLKPTPGRVPAGGHFPLINHPGGLLGVGGPMARTAEDVRRLFQVTAGDDSDDPFSAPVPLRQPSLEGLRVGLWEQFYGVPVQPPLRKAVQKAARALGQLGFAVEPMQPRGLERAPELWWFFFGRLAAPFIKQMVAGREQDVHWTGLELVNMALEEPAPTMEQLVENLAARDAMRGALLRQMRACPVLLTPACGVIAFPHRQRRYETGERPIGLLEAMMPLTWVNLLGLPAIVIPFDRAADGLPVGVQLVGRPFEEELLLELAVRLEEARGPFASPVTL